MKQTPDRIEIVDTLEAIAPAAWDALAHGPRADEKALLQGNIEAEPDSVSQGPALAHVESDCEHLPPAFQPESNRQHAESPPQQAESASEEDEANPFISHAFLSSLVESGSVGGRTGWSPLFVLARAKSGDILGAVPAYAKTHSRGEYVFDHAFAEAYHRHGQRYYPKLQVSVPFTPARARKLLLSPQADAQATRAALLEGLADLRARLDAPSIHATFLTRADQDSFSAAGYLLREDRQFHFLNRGYADYAAFLDTLASRKRKALRRERAEALGAGIEVEWLTGSDLKEAHWDAFFAFYQETGARKWGSPYLTRAFFSLIGERMADRILLVMAKRAGRYIAGALNFIGANTLYGRNWGAIEHHPFLHFELCYHQAIDFALKRGLARVEAGAQGEHKLARGYEPVATHSAHFFADPAFARAIGDYLAREREAVQEMGAEMARFTPFRKGPISGN